MDDGHCWNFHIASRWTFKRMYAVFRIDPSSIFNFFVKMFKPAVVAPGLCDLSILLLHTIFVQFKLFSTFLIFGIIHCFCEWVALLFIYIIFWVILIHVADKELSFNNCVFQILCFASRTEKSKKGFCV